MSFIWRVISKLIFPLMLKVRGICFGKNIIVYGFPIITKAKKSKIDIGSDVVLCSQSSRTALGVSKPVIIRAINPKSLVCIGNGSGLSGVTICAMEKVVIGDQCLLGADVTIVDNDFHPLNPFNRRYSKVAIAIAPVQIGKNVFIGTKSIVLKGVTIGDNSVIGAGSVVVSDIPANVVAAGNPCKVIKALSF